jgi:Zn-dependent protease
MIFSGADPARLLAVIVALVVGITFHEFMHAFTADQLGDRQPRALGRVSLNPIVHIEPIGAIFFLIAGFGWGKPVPVNAYALRPGRIGMSYVSLAGPLANLFVASVGAIVFRGADMAGLLAGSGDFLTELLFWIVLLNVTLCLFNLLPIPPLDGYNLVLPLLPLQTAYTIQRYAQYGIILLVILVVLPGAGPLGWLFDGAAAITRLLTGV